MKEIEKNLNEFEKKNHKKSFQEKNLFICQDYYKPIISNSAFNNNYIQY